MKQEKRLLIYNPRAGRNGSRPSLAQVVTAVRKEDGPLDVKLTEAPGHAEELAATLGAQRETVVCCGGDGTLHEVVNGLLKSGSKAKLCYLPIGSTNDLAKNIGIPATFDEAAALLGSGHTNGYDVGAFNDRHFNYIASFGPGTSVSYATSQAMKNKLGYSAYMLNGFLFQVIPTLRAVKPKHLRIEYDGKVLEDDFYFGAVSNALTVAGLFKYDKCDVKFNDGKFEVFLVRRIKNPLQIFPMLRKIRRQDYDGDTLIYFQASDLRFQFEKPEPWTLDGEFGGNVQEAKIRVLNNAVRIYAPESTHFLPDAAEPDAVAATR